MKPFKHSSRLGQLLVAAVRGLSAFTRKGREQRAQQRAIALIQKSDLFDADWYLARNPDVAASGLDPARHYLLHGWREGRNPSSKFNGTLPLAGLGNLSGANPMREHILRGRASGEGATHKRPEEPADPPTLLNVAFEVGNHPASWRGQRASAAGDGKPLFMLGSAALGYGQPGADAMQELRRQIDLLLRLGRQTLPRRQIDSRGEDVEWPEASGSASALSAAAVLHFADAGAPRIADGWFVGGRALRLRFDNDSPGDEGFIVTALQFRADGNPVLSETAISGSGPDFLDVKLVNALLPVLLVVTSPSGEVRASTLLPFPSLCRDGLHDGEALAVAAGLTGLDAVRRTSENLLACWGDGDETGTRPDWIEVDLAGATGAEGLFSADLRAWLAQVPGVGIRARTDRPERADPGATWLRQAVFLDARRTSDAPRLLRMTADSVPTLHALFGSCRAGQAPFILCCGPEATPAWQLSPPEIGFPVETSQPEKSGPFPCFIGTGFAAPDSLATTGPAPAVLRLAGAARSHSASLLAPCSPLQPMGGPPYLETLPVTAVLRHPAEPHMLAALLEALAAQDRAIWSGVMVITEAATAGVARDALRHVFPEVGHVVVRKPNETTTACFNRATGQARGELLLMLGSPVLLHDRRTLAHLAGLLAPRGVASTACTLIAPAPHGNRDALRLVGIGCYTCEGVPFQATSSRRYLQDSLAALPPACWPVPANSPALFLARRSDWSTLGGFSAGAEAGTLTTRFWEAAAEAGRLHLATTALTATLIAGAATSSAGGPSAPSDSSSPVRTAMTAIRIPA